MELERIGGTNLPREVGEWGVDSVLKNLGKIHDDITNGKNTNEIVNQICIIMEDLNKKIDQISHEDFERISKEVLQLFNNDILNNLDSDIDKLDSDTRYNESTIGQFLSFFGTLDSLPNTLSDVFSDNFNKIKFGNHSNNDGTKKLSDSLLIENLYKKIIDFLSNGLRTYDEKFFKMGGKITIFAGFEIDSIKKLRKIMGRLNDLKDKEIQKIVPSYLSILEEKVKKGIEQTLTQRFEMDREAEIDDTIKNINATFLKEFKKSVNHLNDNLKKLGEFGNICKVDNPEDIKTFMANIKELKTKLESDGNNTDGYFIFSCLKSFSNNLIQCRNSTIDIVKKTYRYFPRVLRKKYNEIFDEALAKSIISEENFSTMMQDLATFLPSNREESGSN